MLERQRGQDEHRFWTRVFRDGEEFTGVAGKATRRPRLWGNAKRNAGSTLSRRFFSV